MILMHRMGAVTIDSRIDVIKLILFNVCNLLDYLGKLLCVLIESLGFLPRTKNH